MQSLLVPCMLYKSTHAKDTFHRPRSSTHKQAIDQSVSMGGKRSGLVTSNLLPP